MFELTQTPFGPYRRYTFRHPARGTGFSIVPERGATVLDLLFDGAPVLDGYPTPEALGAGQWGKSALLFPFPNRLRDGQYRWLGRDYAFPLNNPDTGNAIHGFVCDEAFVPLHLALDTEQAGITCRLDYEGRHAAYPFPFTLDATFRITVQNEFDVSFLLKNRHREAIPAGLGWHPYFRLADLPADAHHLRLPDCEQVAIDARMIPTGERRPCPAFAGGATLGDTALDNCFFSKQKDYHLELHAGGQHLRVSTAGGQFPFFQVFVPPARDSVALEPMTCNVNAFQNGEGLVSVPAGGEWAVAFQIGWRRG